MHSKRVISILIGVFFILNQIALPAQGLAEVEAISVSKDNIPSPPKIDIPSEFGTIEESHIGTNGKTIVYIQDAHDSLEAQTSIAKIITHLVEHYGIKAVFEEGYEGPVPTDKYFGFISDRKIKERVSYFLLDKLRIGGAEFAHINRELDFDLIGVDNVNLYLENIEWYRESAKRRNETEDDLKEIEKHLKKMANKYFPKDMKEWMKLKSRLDVGKLPLLDYVKRTISSMGSSASESSNAYPIINLLLNAEKSGDLKVAEEAKQIEAKALFKEIQQLENDLAESSFDNIRDRKIFHYYKGIQLLKRLNGIEITSEEYEVIRATIKDLTTETIGKFVADHARKTLVFSKRWEENIQNAIKFYEITRARDQFVEEALNMQSENGSSALVFGGFHKSNLTEILERNGFSYFIVTPRIKEISKVHQTRYINLMKMGQARFQVSPLLPLAARQLSDFFGANGNTAFQAGLNVLLQTAVNWAREVPTNADVVESNRLMTIKWRRSELLGAASNVARSETRSKQEFEDISLTPSEMDEWANILDAGDKTKLLQQVKSRVEPFLNASGVEELVLGSGSPRKKKIVSQMLGGRTFRISAPDIDEYLPVNASHEAAASIAALQKTIALVSRREQGILVTNDTFIYSAGRRLGKLENSLSDAEVLDVYRSYASQEILAYSGLAVLDMRDGRLELDTGVASMKLRPLDEALNVTDREVLRLLVEASSEEYGYLSKLAKRTEVVTVEDVLRAYVASGKWKGKAGGFGVQDREFWLSIKEAEGNPLSIVGLPSDRLAKSLNKLGMIVEDKTWQIIREDYWPFDQENQKIKTLVNGKEEENRMWQNFFELLKQEKGRDLLTDWIVNYPNRKNSLMRSRIEELLLYLRDSHDFGEGLFERVLERFPFLNDLHTEYKAATQPRPGTPTWDLPANIGKVDFLGTELHGPNLLDVGAGMDGLNERIVRLNSTVTHSVGTDIEMQRDFNRNPYDITGDAEIEFRLMTDARHVPVEADWADTTILTFVGHHVDVDLQSFLKELHRVAKPGGRVLVLEDTFSTALPLQYADVDSQSESQSIYDKFMDLENDEDRMKFLHLADWFVHTFVNRSRQVLVPGKYKTLEQWQEEFTSAGFEVEQVRNLGISRIGSQNPVPRGLLILKKRSSAPIAEATTKGTVRSEVRTVKVDINLSETIARMTIPTGAYIDAHKLVSMPKEIIYEQFLLLEKHLDYDVAVINDDELVESELSEIVKAFLNHDRVHRSGRMPNLPQKQIVMHLEVDGKIDVSSLRTIEAGVKGQMVRVHVRESGVVTKLLELAEPLKESIGEAEFIDELKDRPEVSYDESSSRFSVYHEFLENFLVQMQNEFAIAIAA